MSQVNNPLVSVVITCFNHVNYITDAVESVVSQDYSNTELIVIDDGSTDGSEVLLDELAIKHSFQLVHQKNAGVAKATNNGLSLCRGKYVATLDSDDVFFSDKLRKQVLFMEQRPDVAVCGGALLLIDEKGRISSPRRFPDYRELNFEDVLMERKDIIASSSALIRKEVINEVGGYDPEYRIQDLYFWLKITAAGYKIAGLRDLLIYYREHCANNHSNYKAVIDCTLSLYKQYEEHELYETVLNKFLISMFLKMAKKDKAMAYSILLKIKPSRYTMKVFRGILRLANPFT